MYSCHLFLISSNYNLVRFLLFLFFVMPLLAWNGPLMSLMFLRRSLVFPILLFFSISWHCSFKKAFLSSPCFPLELYIQLGISFSFSFVFLFSAICKATQTTILPSYISFSWGWIWSLPPVECYKPLSIVLQAFCLPALIPWIDLSPPLYNYKGFDLGHIWMA